MPRVSKETADRHRSAIIDASARLFRERGIDGVSVSDLMAEAGLTHGGFYGHFLSKDVLAAEACTRAFQQSSERWKTRISGKRDRSAQLGAIIEGYLSPQSRNSPGTSCATAALVNDISREPAGAPVRDAYANGVKILLDILGSLQPAGNAATNRRRTLAQFSTMVGALVLARATRGDSISDEFLAAARDFLTATGDS
jgi:TetR/AcrR family transcriptional repressor of nem operon